MKEILVHNGKIHQVPFSDDKASSEGKKNNWRTIVRNTCMKLNCSINFHPEFYEMAVQTDSVYKDQTVQFDVGSVLPVNVVDIFCQTYNFEMAVFRFLPYA